MNMTLTRVALALLALAFLVACTERVEERLRSAPQSVGEAPPRLSDGTGRPTPHDRRAGAAVIDVVAPQEGARLPVAAPDVLLGSGQFVRPGTATSRNEAAATSGIYGPEGGDVVLNFVETDVREVIRLILGETLGLTYTVDSNVSGTVTLRSRRPVARDALFGLLETILADHNLAIVGDGDLYRIVQVAADGSASSAGRFTMRPRARSGYGTEIFPLAHTAASELQKLAQSVLGPQAQVSIDERRNLLIVSGSSEQRQAMQEMLDLFDVDWMQGMSYGLLPVTSADPSTIISELEAIYGLDEGGPLAGQIRFIPIERLGVILTIAKRPGDLARVRQWVNRLDRGLAENGRRLYVYYAQHARAAEMVPILQDIFQSTGRSAGTGTTASSRPGDLAAGLEPVRVESADTGMSAAAPGGAPSPRTAVGGAGLRPENEGGITDRGVQITADETNNAVFILATPRDFRLIEAAIENLDLIPLQVLIEATIAEVTLNDELRYGVQWFFESGNNSATFSSSESGEVNPAFPGFSYLLNAANARVVLNALTSVTDVNVISSPQLMVLDNRSATLQVGDQVPVATQSAVPTVDANAPIINQIEFRDTGVILKVTPRVNASGTVNMDIEQEVSDVVPTTTSGIDSPTIRQRRISSTVAIRSGQTVALGGLIRDSISDVITGVPVLSDIPIVGNLFKTTGNNKDRTELLVLITPIVIRDDSESLAVTDQLRRRLRALQPLVERIE